MNNLIFVPELGLISGKSHHLKSRMWYPQPLVNRLRQKSYSKAKRVSKLSPFNKTKQFLSFRTPSPNKKPEAKSGLEMLLQHRQTKSVRSRKKNLKDLSIQNDKNLPAFDLSLNPRPLTHANARRKLADLEFDPYANLPTIQQRP